MKTAERKPSRFFSIPEYSRNAVIQLIIASGVGFVALHFARVIFMAFAGDSSTEAVAHTYPYVTISNLQLIKQHWWTIFTYGWSHFTFWEWISNMIWLYCFGSIVQMLIGHKQIIPLFVYSIITGGLFFAGIQLFPDFALPPSYATMGAQAGIMGLMTAALTLSPKYRIYLGDNLGIPLLVVAIVFVVLMLLNTNMLLPSVGILAGGALTGFVYIRLMKAGYRPGEWVYTLFSRMENSVTPNANNAWHKEHKKRNKVLSARQNMKSSVSQQRIDEILDKINLKGYASLSKEEKDFLAKLSKDADE